MILSLIVCGVLFVTLFNIDDVTSMSTMVVGASVIALVSEFI